jgi:hypothetical protein
MALSTLRGGSSNAVLELDRLAEMYQETPTLTSIQEKITSLKR